MTSVLGRLRERRRTGIALFVLLVLLVGAERRLAEFHLNQRSTAPAIENNETVDGDELRVRLVVLNDDKPPTLVAVAGTSAPHRALVTFVPPSSVALGRPAPRGPPAPSAPIA